MLSFISLILVLIGCANWLTIGLLQFDFVAGLFGSQSNIFSRIVYVLVGVAAVIMSFMLIKNKGKLTFKNKKVMPQSQPKPAMAESGSDNAKQEQQPNNMETAEDCSSKNAQHTNLEASKDYANNSSNQPQQNPEQANYNQNQQNSEFHKENYNNQ